MACGGNRPHVVFGEHVAHELGDNVVEYHKQLVQRALAARYRLHRAFRLGALSQPQCFRAEFGVLPGCLLRAWPHVLRGAGRTRDDLSLFADGSYVQDRFPVLVALALSVLKFTTRLFVRIGIHAFIRRKYEPEFVKRTNGELIPAWKLPCKVAVG